MPRNPGRRVEPAWRGVEPPGLSGSSLGPCCVVLVLGAVSWVPPAAAQDARTLTIEQRARFLATAEVVDARQIGSGVTQSWRLTLSDGSLTHDAAFNDVNARSRLQRFADGTVEVGFVDSYRYNVAAFALATLLGLDDLIPVTVERRWDDRIGSLSWWIDDAITETERVKEGRSPPDTQAWNRQAHRVRLFTNLVHDTDRHAGNMLVTPRWHAWLIDFTRAFRTRTELQAPDDLTMIEGAALDRLRGVTSEDVAAATGTHLLDEEIDALLERRDRIVDHFERLIGERGRGAVVYELPP